MSDTIRAWLDHTHTLDQNATQGPWRTGSWQDRSFQHHHTIAPEVGHRTIGDVTDNHEGNAEWIAHSRTALPAAVAALRAVLDLHQPEEFHDEPGAHFCGACQRTAGVWPCQTVAAVQGAAASHSTSHQHPTSGK